MMESLLFWLLLPFAVVGIGVVGVVVWLMMPLVHEPHCPDECGLCRGGELP